MSLVVDAARGALWVAGATTRLGFGTAVFAASAVVTLSRACQAVEDAVEVLGFARRVLLRRGR